MRNGKLAMMRMLTIVFITTWTIGCASAPPAVPVDPNTFMEELASGAIAMKGNVGYHRAVSGANAEAQEWFDQGVRYAYGFNQDAAAACFAKAALASPECPMAWWGIAHALAVDINNQDVTPQEAERALSAITVAQRLADHASPLEQVLIRADAARTVVPPRPKTDRRDIDLAYAAVMKEAWDMAPQDSDMATLYAEALMNLQPWDYWTADGEPVDRAEEIVSTLEEAIRLNKNNPGPNHFYIHMVESSKDPARGVPSADRLGKLEPQSGHLVHMPSHIYINVGRYNDAVKVNERACELDDAYFEAYKKPTFYRVYYLHNIHFVTFGAMMEGRRELALQYVQRMEDETPEDLLKAFAPIMDGLAGLRMHIYIRFGMWEEILALPEYPEFRKASRAIRRYARTVALANLGRTQEARTELALFRKAAAETPDEWQLLFNPCRSIYALAEQMAEAEILWRENNAAKAIALLRKAVKAERALTYTEPPAWMIPVRHALGAIQLASGDAMGAVQTYREDLAKNKENAWSLLGLHQSLETLGKLTEAAVLKPRMDRAWSRADITPPASCYCGAEIK